MVAGGEYDRWTLRIAMNRTATRPGIWSGCPWPCLLRGPVARPRGMGGNRLPARPPRPYLGAAIWAEARGCRRYGAGGLPGGLRALGVVRREIAGVELLRMGEEDHQEQGAAAPRYAPGRRVEPEALGGSLAQALLAEAPQPAPADGGEADHCESDQRTGRSRRSAAPVPEWSPRRGWLSSGMRWTSGWPRTWARN